LELKKILNEKFKNYIPDIFGGHVELLINPSKSELDNLIKDQKMLGTEVKILVLADKEIMYATKGDSLHECMIKSLKINTEELSYSRGILERDEIGEWKLIKLLDFQTRIKENKEEMSKYNWRFISNPTKNYEYIDISFLDKYLE
jgi:hypothetical protein